MQVKDYDLTIVTGKLYLNGQQTESIIDRDRKQITVTDSCRLSTLARHLDQTGDWLSLRIEAPQEHQPV
jgi:hypothetical protein